MNFPTRPSGGNNWRSLTMSFRSKDAHAAVINAVKQGILKPAKNLFCVDCGKPAHSYDHRDYTKHLDVAPVCRKCNCVRGTGYPHLATKKEYNYWLNETKKWYLSKGKNKTAVIRHRITTNPLLARIEAVHVNTKARKPKSAEFYKTWVEAHARLVELFESRRSEFGVQLPSNIMDMILAMSEKKSLEDESCNGAETWYYHKLNPRNWVSVRIYSRILRD